MLEVEENSSELHVLHVPDGHTNTARVPAVHLMLKRIELERFKGRAVCFSRFIQSGIFYPCSITETDLVHCMLKVIQQNHHLLNHIIGPSRNGWMGAVNISQSTVTVPLIHE